jgi:hypothetical protein
LLSEENKLLRHALTEPFNEIEVLMEEEALSRIGRGGAEIRNQYA